MYHCVRRTVHCTKCHHKPRRWPQSTPDHYTFTTQSPPFPPLLPREASNVPEERTIAGYDDELAKAIADEGQRQEDHVELIASENYASPRVMEAQGSSSPTSTPKAIRASATTVAANTWTSPRSWRSSA
jgi:hypothetical protein